MSNSVPQSIPVRQEVVVDSIAQSVGGTLYGVTPGGTRIVYDRTTLLHLRNSPYSKTPPVLPDVGSLKAKSAMIQRASANAAAANSASPSQIPSSAQPSPSQPQQHTPQTQHAQKENADDAEMFDME
jgi:hypothetical protein